MGESKPKSTDISSGPRPIEGVGTAVAALVVVSAIGSGVGWLLARKAEREAAQHAREALKAARDAADAEARAASALVRSPDADEA